MEQVISFFETYGLIGLLGGLVIEAMGVPFPGGVMIMFLGFLVNQNKINFYSVYLVAILGFNVGAAIAYYIGKHMGGSLFSKRIARFLGITQSKMNQSRQWLEQSSPWFIIIGRFVPMASNLIPYMAGASGLGWCRFVFYNFIFTVIWVSFNISIGMIFGHNWPSIAMFLNNKLPIVAGILLTSYLAFKFLIKRFNETRSEKV